MTTQTVPRDLVGYGGIWPDLRWPDGSRLAVSVVVNFEEGAEQQVLDGDPTSERMGEVMSVVPDGRPDPGQAQIFAYGTRAGAWRMAAALRTHAIPATILACGRAAQRAPGVLAMLAEGHEVASHGWLWRPHADYTDPQTEAADLDRTAQAIIAATGQTPQGFFCRGAESPWTRQLLHQRGYLYTSNGFDDDLPYSDAATGLLVVPYALDSNDMKFFHPNGFVRAQDMIDYVSDALEVLEAEAARGQARVLNIGFHLRITGRPARFKAFDTILRLLDQRRGGLWLATRAQIAQAFVAAVPCD